MMRHVLFAAALLASCGGPSASGEPVASQTSSRSETQAAAEEIDDTEPTPLVAAEPEHVAPAAIPAGPRPVLAIRGAPDRGGHVSIAIENRGTELARVAPQVMIEREQGGTYSVLPAASLDARPDCEHAAPECIELAPGGALHPPEWLGTIGDAQCACERCTPAERGMYRFVVTTCDGAHRLEGEPFELVP